MKWRSGSGTMVVECGGVGGQQYWRCHKSRVGEAATRRQSFGASGMSGHGGSVIPVGGGGGGGGGLPRWWGCNAAMVLRGMAPARRLVSRSAITMFDEEECVREKREIDTCN
jgi:hypothetical protein